MCKAVPRMMIRNISGGRCASSIAALISAVLRRLRAEIHILLLACRHGEQIRELLMKL